jgi:hypothetical protein
MSPTPSTPRGRLRRLGCARKWLPGLQNWTFASGTDARPKYTPARGAADPTARTPRSQSCRHRTGPGAERNRKRGKERGERSPAQVSGRRAGYRHQEDRDDTRTPKTTEPQKRIPSHWRRALRVPAGTGSHAPSRKPEAGPWLRDRVALGLGGALQLLGFNPPRPTVRATAQGPGAA